MGAGSGPPPAEVFALRKTYDRHGYPPVPVYTGQKRPWGNDWRNDALRDPPLAVQQMPTAEAMSTGIATRQVVAVDADVLIAKVVNQIVGDILMFSLGDTPLVRIGLSPKTLLCYR